MSIAKSPLQRDHGARVLSIERDFCITCLPVVPCYRELWTRNMLRSTALESSDEVAVRMQNGPMEIHAGLRG